jgi:hypothetical protein
MKDLSQQDHSIQPKPQFEDDNLPDQAARFQSAFTAMPDAALLISPIRRPSGEIVDFRLDVANQAAEFFQRTHHLISKFYSLYLFIQFCKFFSQIYSLLRRIQEKIYQS